MRNIPVNLAGHDPPHADCNGLPWSTRTVRSGRGIESILQVPAIKRSISAATVRSRKMSQMGSAFRRSVVIRRSK